VAQDEFPAQGRQEMRLAASRQAEGQDVVSTIHKAAIDQRGQLPPDFGRQQRLIERAERLGLRQPRLGEQPRRALLGAFHRFALAQVAQHLTMAPAFLLGAPHHLLVLACHGRQAKRTQQHRGRVR
jgi:hypothetical protein